MPQGQLKSIAAKHGIPLATLEEWWAEARRDYGDDFKAVMGTVMERLRNHEKAHAEAIRPKDS